MALQPQQRALAILAGVFGGGLLIAFLAVSLISGDDNKEKKISVGPNQPSTSTSSSTLLTLPTLPSTTQATTPQPPVTPSTGVTPGTIIVVPTSPPPTTATTAPTTSTTHPPTVAEELETLLEETLLGGEEPPPPGTPPRVRVTYNADDFVRVSWNLDETLSDEEQRYAAREEATALLRVIQGYDRIGDERIILRALLPDPDTGDPHRVVRLVFERATLDAIDFTTVDPLTIFELADDADIDPALEPAPPPTTSTSSTTSTT
jgi:hypothetical protein